MKSLPSGVCGGGDSGLAVWAPAGLEIVWTGLGTGHSRAMGRHCQ